MALNTFKCNHQMPWLNMATLQLKASKHFLWAKDHRPTNETWWETKTHVDLTYFTGFLGHHGKLVCAFSQQITDLYSQNLHHRCIWHGCKNDIHPRIDHKVQNVKIRSWINQGGTSRNRSTQRIAYWQKQWCSLVGKVTLQKVIAAYRCAYD